MGLILTYSMKYITALIFALIFSIGGYCQQVFTKEIRQVAKELRKEGWKTVSGSESLESQVALALSMQEIDDGNLPKRLVGARSAIGRDYASARQQAFTLAKADLAGSLETQIAASAESFLSSDNSKNMTSVSSKAFINDCINRTDTVMEIYKLQPNGQIEVYISLSCNLSEIGSSPIL